jgi:hypothetical protein
LESLEADNYVEEHDAQNDEAYIDDEVRHTGSCLHYEHVLNRHWRTLAHPPKKAGKRKQKVTNRNLNHVGECPLLPMYNGRHNDAFAKVARRVKPLTQIIEEQDYRADAGEPNYVSAAAGPSKRPQRQFCSVCGYFGIYTCTRCGMRFCSTRCNNHHKETRCLKFSV